MAGPLRWMKCAAVATMMLAALGHRARAQYLFNYTVFTSFTQFGPDGVTPSLVGGAPFSDPICSGTTSSINYDNNSRTDTPKMLDWCPGLADVGEHTGDTFAAEFSGVMFSTTAGLFDFYVGSDDGSALYVDGVQVMSLEGEQPFHSATVQVAFAAGTAHTYLLDYYANDNGGSAIQATVDSRVNVGTDLASVIPTPEVPPDILVASGFGLMGIVERVRRRKRQAS